MARAISIFWRRVRPAFLAAAILLVLSSPVPALDAGSSPPALFEAVAGPQPAGAVRAPRRYRTGSQFEPGRWKPGQRWRLPLAEDAEGVAGVSSLAAGSDGSVLVRGRVEGVPGSEVFIVDAGERLASLIRIPHRNPVLLLPAGDHYRLQLVNESAGPRCATMDFADPGGVLHGELKNPKLAGLPPADTGATNILEIAFFHTPAAELNAGGPAGMRALLQLALLETNDAFQRSDARLEIRPVCQLRVEYAESGEISTDLERLIAPGDGWLDEIHRLRQQYAADLVCLVTEFEERNEYAGIATQLWDITPDALAAGFTVCLRAFMVGNYTLPHEIGHLLGGNHDRETSARSGLEPWSFATRIQVDGVLHRTIMAYRPGVQFPHFSNPDVFFRGVPTGEASGALAANNVRTFRRTAPLIAAIRNPPNRVGFTSDKLEVNESAGSVRVTWQQIGDAVGTSFRLSSSDGSAQAGVDYVAVDREVTLGTTDFEQGIEIIVQDNDLADGPRQFLLRMDEPSVGLALGPCATVLVTIIDDETEALAPLDTSLQARPGADYLVTSLAATPDGALYAAGGFATYNGERHSRLVRLRPDGSADPQFNAEIKYRVNALALFEDGRLAIGGEFNTVGGRTLQQVAVLRPDGTPDPRFQFDPGADQPIHALLALPGGNLLIGGGFTNIHRTPVIRVARLLPTGRRDSAFLSTEGPDGDVFALALTREMQPIIGGAFNHVGDRSVSGVARLHADGGLDERFQVQGSFDGPVRALAVDAEDRVIVVGDFRSLQNQPVGAIVRLTRDGRFDETFQAGEGADGPILAIISSSDGGWWVAGGFTRFDGRVRRRVARLHADGSLDEGFDPGIGPDDWVYALALRGDGTLVAGGLFTTVSGVVRGGIAGFLTDPIHPPRFTAISRLPAGLEWQAEVMTRQSYAVERSSDLRSWEPERVVHGPGWQAVEHWYGTTNAAGFIRLRRILQ